MRLRNPVVVLLAVSLGSLCANVVRAGPVTGTTYIYVANDSTTDTITYSATTGGTSTTLLNTVTGSDPHQIVIGNFGNSENYLFVANDSSTGSVSEYLTNGDVVNTSLITGLSSPVGLAVSGDDLFVANYNTGIIGEYVLNANGQVTASTADFITLPTAAKAGPDSLLASGGDLYVAATGTGDVYGYTTAGASLAGFTTITGIGYNNANGGAGSLNDPIGLAVSNGDLFVADSNTSGVDANSIGEFNASTGATINAQLISTGLSSPTYLAVNTNGDLLVANHGSTTVGEYTTSGGTVNASFITGLTSPFGIAVGVAVPLPPVWLTFAACAGMVLIFRQVRRRGVDSHAVTCL